MLVAPLVHHTRAHWIKSKPRERSKVKLLLHPTPPLRNKRELLTLALVALLPENPPEIRDTHTVRRELRPRHGEWRRRASPDELLAVETEGGLPQEGGHELVSVDLVDPPPQGAVALPGELLVRLLLHRGLV